MSDEHLTIDGIADLLKRPSKKVRDIVVHLADFPAVAMASGPRSRLWLAEEVRAWAAKQAGRRCPAPTLGSS